MARILIIDDQDSLRTMLRLVLERAHYDVVEACDGQEGLQSLDTAAYDLIITDILMPKLDGYAFVQKLRLNPETRAIPVVFLSATYVTPEDRDFALSLGAARFMEKPIDTEDFLLTIAELVTQQPFAQPAPLDMEKFYAGYRTRLENKLRHKNTQIARAERLLPTLPSDQKPAFEALLQQSVRDRDEIQSELDDIYKTLDELNN